MVQRQPDHGGAGIAAYERPRLCQRAGMHGKQQHSRSRQGAEQVQRHGGTERLAAGKACEQQAEQCTDACAYTFFKGDVQWGRQQPVEQTAGRHGEIGYLAVNKGSSRFYGFDVVCGFVACGLWLVACGFCELIHLPRRR
ncbi:hypothetical protein D3C77_553320 [compost metagenome]